MMRTWVFSFLLRPLAALAKILAAEARHPRRRHEVFLFEAIDVGVHDPEQTIFPAIRERFEPRDDELGFLELHQMMKLQARFFLACCRPISCEDLLPDVGVTKRRLSKIFSA